MRMVVLVIGLLALAPVQTAVSQEMRLPRDEYFRLIGQYERFAGMEHYLLERLAQRLPDWAEDRRKQRASFFAYVMAANGLSADLAAALESEGVDVVHAITADSRPFIEQALLTDLVVIGEAVGERPAERDDGYETSALINVLWTLKGTAPADTIVIRQRPRREGRTRDVRPEMGGSYLLLLSNGLYRYSAANHAARNEGWLPAADSTQNYIVYRIYRIEDGRLDWGGYTPEATERAFQEIRRLDQLLALHGK